MYCFTSWDGYMSELKTSFGSECQMRKLFKEFLGEFQEDTVMEYYHKNNWERESFEEVLNSNSFIFVDCNGYEYQADVFKVKRTHGRWPALKLTISRWRTATIRKLISFLKKYEY